jgi:uncharacterized protein YrrD
VLAHRNNSPLVDIFVHSDTLFWFQANQSLLFLLNAAFWAKKRFCNNIHQVPSKSKVLGGYYVPDEGYYVHDEGYYVPHEGYYVHDEGYYVRNNSPLVDIFVHSDTLFWFQANQSLLFLLNAAFWAKKQQLLML